MWEHPPGFPYASASQAWLRTAVKKIHVRKKPARRLLPSQLVSHRTVKRLTRYVHQSGKMSFTSRLSESVVNTELPCTPQAGQNPALGCDVEPVDLQQLCRGTALGRVGVAGVEEVLENSQCMNVGHLEEAIWGFFQNKGCR